MIRIAHCSDLHYGPKNLAEADRCFGAAVDRAIALGAQVAVLSGDATDHALDLHSPSAERLARQVRRLADHCPVLMLQGTFSHEPPGTLGLFRLLGGRYPVHVADRIAQVGLMGDGRWVVSDGWRFDEVPAGVQALFSCVPTVNKAMVAATMGASAAAEATGEQLAALLAGFAPGHRAARRQGVPTIGVSHGTVFGCLSEHGVPMAGFDHEFTTGALFASEAQAFMLGHIHRHQAWQRVGTAGHQCVAYAGSIGRFHYGEEGEKGFLMWEVDADGARFDQVPTPARRTVDIVFEGKPDIDALRTAIAQQDIAGAHVRVRWTVADEDRHEVDRALIERELGRAAEVKLEGRIVPVVRTRAAGISRASSLADKVRQWAQVTDAKPGPLLACLARLDSETGEVIAERILRGAMPNRLEGALPRAVDTAVA
ncbi:MULTISPECIES: DNA repair exonuclease [unclassified Methylibium]|jgi:exonuclease SbcD|uniref:metallophosphoesterase family protein n=1 Tax=unclassified Methylibium TaxID=2633235 RepID=UPI0003F43B39|nr:MULTISPECIES: DNA repair exonuclease [unclassified Methylibium]EWS56839.1 Calcineurin-like phosphoesterase superfamily domain protein [Methylibium sp. T29]EWS61999.1 Calcineurin-like phosphoesterase superfamily domain protein [Methylibium sp. T29-B]